MMLGIPDIQLLNILKITCQVISVPHESGKFDSQTTNLSNALVAEETEPCSVKQTKWVHMLIMQKCQIILSLAKTK